MHVMAETCGSQVDDWECPICFELLYKPCVNVCGHIFCFWCMHQAMNPYRPSQCPLCRANYTHFPKVYEQLHVFLAKTFPAEYASRAEETAASEAERAIQSQDMPLPPPAPAAADAAGEAAAAAAAAAEADADAAPAAAARASRTTSNASVSAAASPAHFCCTNPACSKLLHNPVVLSCGHAVCSATCRVSSSSNRGGSSNAAAPAAPAAPAVPAAPAAPAAPAVPEAEQPDAKQQGAQPQPSTTATTATTSTTSTEPAAAAAAAAAAVAAAAGPSSPTPAASRSSAYCPGCGMHVMPGAQPCGQVQGLLQKLFPQESAQRATEVAQQQQQQSQQQDDGAGEAEAAAAAERRKAHLQQLQALLREQTAPGAGGAGSSSSSSSSTREAWRQITDLVAQDADETYTWYMVGCDYCGVYPIVGRRYKCKDCPEAIGFDLCGACRDSGITGVGRFNQAHTAGHELVQIPPRLNFMDGITDVDSLLGYLNVLALLHPELQVEQIMALAGMQVSAVLEDLGEAGEGEGEAQQEGEAQEGQGQGQAGAAGAAGGGRGGAARRAGRAHRQRCAIQ